MYSDTWVIRGRQGYITLGINNEESNIAALINLADGLFPSLLSLRFILKMDGATGTTEQTTRVDKFMPFDSYQEQFIHVLIRRL